jgi:putative DNA primase/helicase
MWDRSLNGMGNNSLKLERSAVMYLIRALGGNERSGMCQCPAHDDDTPSLQVSAGYKVPVVLHCHARCTFPQIVAALAHKNLWPVPGTKRVHAAPQFRSEEERRRYAVRILDDTLRNQGREQAVFLETYFKRRGIEQVPVTALLAMPYKFGGCKRLYLPDSPAMVFPVSSGRRTIGIHVTYLSPDLSQKREQEPQRQCFGPIRGGFVKLFHGFHDPDERLLIGEGIENACSVAQMTGSAAISALSATNMPLINPPRAREYIICADNDRNGTGQMAARTLAAKLVGAGFVVRVAIPEHPDTDWNDVCLKERGTFMIKGEGHL